MSTEDISMKTTDVERHTIGQSILLHLLPGMLVGALYFAVAEPIRNLGYPSLAALMLALIVILIPFELGFLLYQGKKKNGSFSLDGIVLFRQQIPKWEYFVWVPIVFIFMGLVFTGLAPVSSYFESLFSWLPEALHLDLGLGGEYSKSALIITYSLTFVFGVIVAPIIEELYFRSYLLPRMPRLKGWAPILHSALFALYHMWTPWMALTRTIAMLPLIYLVLRKKNIYLAIFIHCLANVMDVIVGVAFIVSLSS